MFFKRKNSGLVLMAFLFSSLNIYAQAVLTARQVSAAQALGRKTDVPLALGTLVQARKGDGFQAFITTPEQRVAYAMSDITSATHGSGVKDALASELHLNRLRVTGLPYPNGGADQHNSRHVVLCDTKGQNCMRPAHELLDANQVVAEFEMPSVLKLSGPGRTILVRIQNDVGTTQPDIQVNLASLEKKK